MRKNHYFLIAALLLCIAACKKEEDNSPAGSTNNNGGGGGGGGNPGAASVYVCGTISNGGGFTDQYPRYWKDGEEIIVGDGSRGRAHEIVVNDEHIIIAGALYNGGAMIPCYWVDNDPLELLSYACGECQATDVFVVGTNDVHVAGYVMNEGVFGSNYKAMYWHNGVGVELTDGADAARAHGVFVYNGDVYVCGYEEDGSGGRRLAKYWVNGTEVVLGNDDESSSAYDIWVEDGDVYVVGYEDVQNSVVGEYIERPVLWINGERQLLSGGDPNADGYAKRIFIQDGNVYIVGTTTLSESSNVNNSSYWVNGNFHRTYDVFFNFEGTNGNDIHVHNGEIHTVGGWNYLTGQSGHYSNNTTENQAFYGHLTNGICIH